MALNWLFCLLKDIGPNKPEQLNMVLSQGLPQMEITASLLGVVHAAPAPVAAAVSPSMFNITANNNAAVINMLGQGIIACNNCIGSLEQLISSVAIISNMT